MRKLTRSTLFIKGLFAVFLFFTGRAAAQSNDVAIQQLGHLINDALFYCDQYVSPATDAAIYQASSGWVTSPKKKDLWKVSLGLHTNVFFTPGSDRHFDINNSDFEFFQLEEGSTADVPSSLGGDHQVYLIGTLGESPVTLETPEGMNMEVVAYPYLQGSIALWGGTELIAKYSTYVRLKKSDYQVYGFGIKHNLSQYFPSLEANKTYFSVLAGYANEDVSFSFLDISTDYGTLGISTINGIVDTWQFQLNGAKEFGRWEAMGGFIVNTSHVKYKVGGKKGTIEEILPLQDVLNLRLEEIYKTRVNYIGEAAIKYNLGNFNIQTILAFGKFVNTNISVYYIFK